MPGVSLMSATERRVMRASSEAPPQSRRNSIDGAPSRTARGTSATTAARTFSALDPVGGPRLKVTSRASTWTRNRETLRKLDPRDAKLAGRRRKAGEAVAVVLR